MHKNLPKRGKVAAAFITMLLMITLIASLLPEATANTVTITIDPKEGCVGRIVQVTGEIETSNGSYIIFFDEEWVKNGTAVDKAVNDIFVVPRRPGGDYNVTLHDETTRENCTDVFTVKIAYYIKAVVPSPPSQLQEGGPTDIWVNVTGGEENTVYSANITVTDPSGAVYYNDTFRLTNTTNTGYGEGKIIYPANFSADAHTNYTGIYNIAFNKSLASGNFTVGLTNATEYHRFQVVGIRAAGYTQVNESAWVNITFAGESVNGFPKNVSAVGGVIEANWTVPSNASLGVYTVTVNSSTTPGTVKTVRDVQNFTVTGGIDPPSGPVGTTVRIVGQIDTQNGTYRILWDGDSVKEGVCDPGSVMVNDTFVVPPSVKGNHNVILYDVTSGTESLPFPFEVTTSYNVSAVPSRIQEGQTTDIWVNVTGGEANTVYFANITVKEPPPANWTYWTTVSLTNTTTTGSGNGIVTYPSNFTAGAHTNYTGVYNIAVNATLATRKFTVGITDRLEYGRTKITNEWKGTEVHIRGAGYGPYEMVFVNITFAGVPDKRWTMLTEATDTGVVPFLWRIPKDAPLGIYTVTLANETGFQVKPVPDIQNFTVVEIVVYCETQNKYDENPLADVTVKAYLDETKFVDSGKTNKTGLVDLRLDRGNYTFKAFWKGEQVGILENQSVTGEAIEYVLQRTFNITCELAYVKIAVNDEAGHALPFINVTLTSNKTEPLMFETDYTGIVATNTFINTSYTIEARRYGHLFNTTPIENLTVTRWINITCPTYTLFAHVLDSKRLPLQNVQVAVYEWSSELLADSGATNDWGSVTISCTFGRYKIRVYDWESGIVLNETVIDLIEDRSFFVIHCRISNVDLSVVVKDYFGNSIPNAVVKVERENVDIPPQKTGSNGKASFENITGGEVRISVSVDGKLCETRTVYLDETRVAVFKLDRYVMVAGYPLETTQFIACISLGMLVALFALALVYRRLRTRKVSEGKEKSL